MISIADFVQAPTPYIIGLLKTENQSDVFSQLSEYDQVNTIYFQKHYILYNIINNIYI